MMWELPHEYTQEEVEAMTPEELAAALAYEAEALRRTEQEIAFAEYLYELAPDDGGDDDDGGIETTTAPSDGCFPMLLLLGSRALLGLLELIRRLA